MISTRILKKFTSVMPLSSFFKIYNGAILSAENEQKESRKGLSLKDLLDIKIGEFLAKTEELREANESLRLANIEMKKRVEDLKKQKRINRNRAESRYCQSSTN